MQDDEPEYEPEYRRGPDLTVDGLIKLLMSFPGDAKVTHHQCQFDEHQALRPYSLEYDKERNVVHIAGY